MRGGTQHIFLLPPDEHCKVRIARCFPCAGQPASERAIATGSTSVSAAAETAAPNQKPPKPLPARQGAYPGSAIAPIRIRFQPMTE
ncbi:hypothetical protein Bxe_B0382 [Paraburkholderia xenovorans LB400]|uniref:Uncharacterized protein n=1 Tax=Paraburkholderia xenovorans (strain LB400) TaxID=266265 RepID=Q13K25_PARXL|nr:hypothetical protein Bxe_B0382 [Paraburkholderia xenovorans LB400]